jgi:hypothetical protein
VPPTALAPASPGFTVWTPDHVLPSSLEETYWIRLPSVQALYRLPAESSAMTGKIRSSSRVSFAPVEKDAVSVQVRPPSSERAT